MLEEVTQDDLLELIAEAIRELYVYIGRGDEEIEDKFIYEEPDPEPEPEPDEDGQTDADSGDDTTDTGDHDDTTDADDEGGEESEQDSEEPEPDPAPIEFADRLSPDEQLWVILTAALAFFKKTQSQYDGLVSYSTDAMAVTHGDAPFKNLQTKIDGIKGERDVVWWRMVRYNML